MFQKNTDVASSFWSFLQLQSEFRTKGGKGAKKAVLRFRCPAWLFDRFTPFTAFSAFFLRIHENVAVFFSGTIPFLTFLWNLPRKGGKGGKNPELVAGHGFLATTFATFIHPVLEIDLGNEDRGVDLIFLFYLG